MKKVKLGSQHHFSQVFLLHMINLELQLSMVQTTALKKRKKRSLLRLIFDTNKQSSFNLTQYEQYELLQNPSDRSKYYHIRTTQTRGIDIGPSTIAQTEKKEKTVGSSQPKNATLSSSEKPVSKQVLRKHCTAKPAHCVETKNSFTCLDSCALVC
ncbi:hypothetical protein YC2023_045711 [Brassica napus]